MCVWRREPAISNLTYMPKHSPFAVGRLPLPKWDEAYRGGDLSRMAWVFELAALDDYTLAVTPGLYLYAAAQASPDAGASPLHEAHDMFRSLVGQYGLKIDCPSVRGCYWGRHSTTAKVGHPRLNRVPQENLAWLYSK